MPCLPKSLLAGLAALMLAPPAPAQQKPAPFLSSLSAGGDAPIYTGYAAQLGRSEFTLDKAYHFVYNDTSRGADFTNDAGGDLCLAFAMGGKYVYQVKDMYRPPVIKAS